MAKLRELSQSGNCSVAVWIINAGLALLLLLPPSAAGNIVASTVALVVAFVAYPWQKSKDRDLQLHAEERAAWKSFFEVCSRYYGAARAKDFDKLEITMHELKAEFNSFALYGSASSVAAARSMVDQLMIMRVAVLREEGKPSDNERLGTFYMQSVNRYREAEKNAVRQARQSIASLYPSDDEAVVENLYRNVTLKVDDEPEG